MSLTDLKIRAVKATAKTQKLFDGRGLFLQVTPTGSNVGVLNIVLKVKKNYLPSAHIQKFRLWQLESNARKLISTWIMKLIQVNIVKS